MCFRIRLKTIIAAVLAASAIYFIHYCLTKSPRTRKSSASPKVKHEVVFFKLKNEPLYVLSAYADYRVKNMVRVIGMAKTGNYDALSCYIFRGANKVEKVKARVEYLPEGHGMKYDAVYVQCNSNWALSSGMEVGLGTQGKSDFIIPVQIIPNMPRGIAEGMTVCYPPLHSGYDNVDQFVENIEMNRILGFRQFFVYVHNVGPLVRKAIDSYAKEGVIHVVSWEAFPLVSGNIYPVPENYTIHYLGQMVAINDCLYRAMNNPFQVVAFHDFDELMIPRHDRYLSDLVAREMGPSVAGLSVRCAMFYNKIAVNSHGKIDYSRLTTQTKTQRAKTILPHRNRSKMLVAANKILIMGIHFVWSFHKGNASHLETEAVLLHHYRDAWKEDTNVIDKTALRYHDVLMGNVKERMKKLPAYVSENTGASRVSENISSFQMFHKKTSLYVL